MSALAAASVDLDSIHHYCRIHGIPESILDERARNCLYAVALPRFLELFDAAGIKGTFFAVGEDLSLRSAKEGLSGAVKAGHEVGNHSFGHDYALSRKTLPNISADLEQAQQVIESATGLRPRGFRAPGYTLSAALYQAVQNIGFSYGSSTFPAAPYYLAKAAVMGTLAMAGRPSRAVLDSPQVMFAPKKPYRPDSQHPYRRGTGRVLELPVCVSPLLGMPFIGTFAVSLPWAWVRATYRSLRKVPLFNLELHGADLLDKSDGLPSVLVAAQKDFRIPVVKKRARLLEVLSWLRRDFDVVRLEDAADILRMSV